MFSAQPPKARSSHQPLSVLVMLLEDNKANYKFAVKKKGENCCLVIERTAGFNYYSDLQQHAKYIVTLLETYKITSLDLHDFITNDAEELVKILAPLKMKNYLSRDSVQEIIYRRSMPVGLKKIINIANLFSPHLDVYVHPKLTGAVFSAEVFATIIQQFPQGHIHYHVNHALTANAKAFAGKNKQHLTLIFAGAKLETKATCPSPSSDHENQQRSESESSTPSLEAKTDDTSRSASTDPQSSDTAMQDSNEEKLPLHKGPWTNAKMILQVISAEIGLDLSTLPPLLCSQYLRLYYPHVSPATQVIMRLHGEMIAQEYIAALGKLPAFQFNPPSQAPVKTADQQPVPQASEPLVLVQPSSLPGSLNYRGTLFAPNSLNSPVPEPLQVPLDNDTAMTLLDLNSPQ